MEYKYDAFISFSSKDQHLVRDLKEKLIYQDLHVFLSDVALERKVGELFINEISDSLEKSKHFILIASLNSLNSAWVQLEYQNFLNVCYAQNPAERKILILKDSNLQVDQIPLLLRSFQITEKSSIVSNFIYENKAENLDRKPLIPETEANNFIKKLEIEKNENEIKYIGINDLLNEEARKQIMIPGVKSRAEIIQEMFDKGFSDDKNGAKIAPGSKNSFVILLVRGEDVEGGKIYAYVAIRSDKLKDFMRAQQEGVFYPEDFGEIIYKGEGNPSDKIIREMEKRYGYNPNSDIDL